MGNSVTSCRSGEWGVVCDNGWSYNEALVVCRQLGYPGAVKNKTEASFGRDHGRVWIEDVTCSGLELKLEECSIQFVGLEVQNCNHGAQAEVSCSKKCFFCV